MKFYLLLRNTNVPFLPSPDSASHRRPSVIAGFMNNFGSSIPDPYVLVNMVLSNVTKGQNCFSTGSTTVRNGFSKYIFHFSHLLDFLFLK